MCDQSKTGQTVTGRSDQCDPLEQDEAGTSVLTVTPVGRGVPGPGGTENPVSSTHGHFVRKCTSCAFQQGK
jgi:hypothetical protein